MVAGLSIEHDQDASTTVVLYYQLRDELWAMTALWGARALVALALDYLLPHCELTYFDSDCGPGCAQTLSMLSSLAGDRKGVPKANLTFGDVGSAVNTGCYVLPADNLGPIAPGGWTKPTACGCSEWATAVGHHLFH